jgi:tetratricopeptide (TPR) repeat protein
MPRVTAAYALGIAIVWQACGASAASAAAGEATSATATIAQAKALVDNYYGQQRDLEQAAALVAKLLVLPKPPSDAYVQAARIVIKGGHIFEDKFEANTARTAGYFVAHALTADPNNVSALSLKASIAMMNGDLPAAYATIQSGLALQASYPWLHLGLARYYERTGDYRAAVKEYGFVVGNGCSNSDPEQRRAFTSALESQARLMRVQGQEALFRRYAEDADRCRDPRDAWTLGNFAQMFNQVAFFDDAIVYARKALAVMDFGAGRKELAMGLYGKAARMTLADEDAAKTLSEANGMGFGPNEVVWWFDSSQAQAHAFTAPVSALLR